MLKNILLCPLFGEKNDVCIFTVFIHVHFQTLLQSTGSALVSVSFVYGTAALHGHRHRHRQSRGLSKTARNLLPCKRQNIVCYYLPGRPICR